MINEREMTDAVFIVTDIEADGPTPGANSMRAFASVAVDANGVERGAFEAVLAPLVGAEPDLKTLAWFQSQPEAWAAATTGAKPADIVMQGFAEWVGEFAGGRVFTAYPLAFDGLWIDYYLRRFTRFALVEGHYAEGRLFDGSGFCLKSYVAAVVGRMPWDCSPASLPPEWFGGHEHTHRAIDDARGYAHLLGVLMDRQRRSATGKSPA